MTMTCADDRSVPSAAGPATDAGAPTRSGESATQSVRPSEERDGRAVSATPWVFSTYFAEGFPYSIVHQVAAQFFTAMNASLSAIGLTSLYGLAWNLKFLWAPFVDQVGTMRRWLCGVQLGLAAVVAALAWPAAAADLTMVARILVLVSILAATHDIAIDGFYLRALGKRDQAALSGLRVGAYRLALLAGNGGLVVLAGRVSWFACFLVAGVVLLLLAIGHALLLPRPQKGDLIETPAAAAPAFPKKKKKPAFKEAFTTFLKQPSIGAILAFILFFRAGDALMFAMSTPLLKDLGLDTEWRGYAGGVGTAASIVGSIIGGALIAKRSLAKTLFPIACIQSLAILAFAWMATVRPDVTGIFAVVVFEQLVAGVGTAAFMVFLMRRCSGDYKASHFAIATALMSVASTVAGSASGYLATAVGFEIFFVIAFVASWPGVALARVVPTNDD